MKLRIFQQNPGAQANGRDYEGLTSATAFDHFPRLYAVALWEQNTMNTHAKNAAGLPAEALGKVEALVKASPL